MEFPLDKIEFHKLHKIKLDLEKKELEIELDKIDQYTINLMFMKIDIILQYNYLCYITIAVLTNTNSSLI